MSGAPREPERYSVDEMMERLKAKPQEDGPDQGELVTRADGSQAIRIRKRKRRSHQPRKEEGARKSRFRTIQVTISLVLIVLVALAAAGLMIYANTGPYREGIIAKASAVTGAEISLRELRVSPANANAAEVNLKWPEGNTLGEITLKSVAAETSLASFLGKSWTGEELRAMEGRFHFRSPVAGAPKRSGSLPLEGENVRFNRIGVANSHYIFGDVAAPAMELLGTESSFYPSGPNGYPQLQLHRGKFRIPGWPEFRMDRSFMEFRGTEVEVVSLRLMDATEDRATMLLTGTLRPYVGEAPSSLSVSVDSFPLSSLIGEVPGKMLGGTIATVDAANSNFLTFQPASDKPGSLQLAFRAVPTSNIQLAKLPFLDALARSLDDTWFRSPVFTDLTDGTLRRDMEVMNIGLDIHSPGRMAVKGEMIIGEALALSGELEIGLAETVVDAAPQSGFDRIFTRSADGFRWMTIRLSGSAAMPKDDFQELLEASRNAAAPAPSAGDSAAEPSFEDLTSPR